jgi:hypothetical protein
MMLAELQILLAAAPVEANREDFRRLVVEENLLGKRTLSNRVRADGYLHILYGLDRSIPIYRCLRQFWEIDVPGRPLLALLAATARDPLLRAAGPGLLAIPIGEAVDTARVAGLLTGPSARFTPKTLRSMAQNIASSFTQSGHLRGRLHKLRTRAVATPSTAAFAAMIGWLEGGRGQLLMSSFWASLIDRNHAEVLDLLLAAGRLGLLDVRSSGGVVELRMDRLLTPAEMELCDGQQG